MGKIYAERTCDPTCELSRLLSKGENMLRRFIGVPTLKVSVLLALLISGQALANLPDTPMVRYSFNEGRGNAAIDQTGFGTDATLY